MNAQKLALDFFRAPLQTLHLRRRNQWQKPTLLDEFLNSPLQALVQRLYFILLWLRGIPVKPPRNRRAIRVVCLADTHSKEVKNVPRGDLLIHAGDLTDQGTASAIQEQIDWLDGLPGFQHKVMICGNHDSWFDLNSRKEEDVLGKQRVNFKSVHYLSKKSASLKFRGGRTLHLYGSSDVPQCGGADNAFQYPRSVDLWKGTIPMDTDILITHAPPRHHLDLGLGCDHMLKEVWRVKPKVHIFGHVHDGRGMEPVFWDESQRAYERFMSRESHGPFRDALPHQGWIDAAKVCVYGALNVVWHWLMLGGSRGATGCVMINAGCQLVNSSGLTTKKPFVVDI